MSSRGSKWALLGLVAVTVLAGSSGVASASAPRWSKPLKLAGVRFLDAVSCPSSSFCVAVGGGRAVIYRAGHWGRSRKIDSNSSMSRGLVTVSCLSASFCLAGDGAGNALIYNGSRWSSPKLVDSQGLVQVSCSARTFCGAVDVSGVGALFFNGSAWSKPARIPGSSQPLSISCRFGHFCMALDGAGTGAWRFDGARWLSAGSIKASNPPGGSEPNVGSAIACSGRKFCAALDNFGEAFTWAGGKWSRPVAFDRNLLAGIDAISCPSRNACVVVDSTGITTRWNGYAWSRTRRIESNAGLADVSCASGRFCVAVDNRGRVLRYQ